MTEQQVTTGTNILFKLHHLKEVREWIKQSAALTFGQGLVNPNYSPEGGVLLGKYTSDLSGENAVTINYRDDKQPAPAWASNTLAVAKAIVCAALDAEINRLQKQFDEL